MMDSSASGTPTCPTCGSALTEEHTCPGSHQASAEDTGQIRIPEALRNTGLFRAAWKPTTPDAPETRGSIFERVEEPVSAAPALADSSPATPAFGTPAVPETAPVPDPWAHLDVKVTDPEGPEANENPWAALSAPSEEILEEETEQALSEEVEDVPATTTLSPIAAAEAAARDHAPAAPEADAAISNAPAASEQTGELELTAAFDVEQSFAAEAGAGLEPVPDPAESAYDLYGDTLYAPTVESADQAASTDALTQAVAAPEPGVPDFGPGALPAGIASASLPSSVPFAADAERDGGPVAAAPDPEAKPRRAKAVLVAVLAVVLVAGAGAWWWTAQKDGPVKDVFGTSHRSFVAAAGQMERASSIDDVARAGEAFAASVAALNTTAEKTRESGSDVSVAARRATLAETAVAQAAAPLADLSSQDLSPWASSKSALTQALDGLDDVRDDIETAGGSTDDLPTSELVTTISDLIAEEVVSGAAETVVDVSAKLEAASLLADVRAVGASAGEYVAPLTEAAQGLEDKGQQDDLMTVVAYHEALKGFTKLRPATMDKWAAMLKEARTAAKSLATGRDEALAGLTAADKLVRDARKDLEAWEAKRAKAEAKQTSEAAALASAATAVEAADSTYADLQAQLETLAKELPTLDTQEDAGEAFSRLDAAAKAREDLLATLTGRELVPSAAKTLEPLVAALQADAEAVRATATAAQSCTEGCRITSSPAWKTMLSTTKDSATAWSEALEPWKQTVETATQKIQDREMPERPKI